MRSGLLTVCFCAALLLPAGSALADSFPVTSSADAGAGSLRAAIGEANATLGPDSIPISATGTIDLTTALPVLAESVDVSGPGVDRLTVSRDPMAPAFRIFDVGPAATVSISGMTIRGGKANEGGGVRSQGPLTLTRVDVTQNLAPATGGNNATAQAGGIFSTGPLTVRESSVVENLAVAHDGSALTEARSGGLRAVAGAVIVASNISLNSAEASSNTGTVLASIAGANIAEPVTILDSTISFNSDRVGGLATTLLSPNAGLVVGAGTITASTITGNGVAGVANPGAANLDAGAATVIRDSIVADPRGSTKDCGAPPTSGGFNLDGGTSCAFNQPTDISDRAPQFVEGGPADNGGPTKTLALRPESAALDHGNAFGSSTDQRGLPRPSDFAAIANAPGGDGSDIGAFEQQVPQKGSPPPPPDISPPDTRIVRGPARRSRARLAVLRFASTEAGSSFECRLDRGPFRPCTAPFKHRVKAGTGHVFLARARDAAGNLDPSPAKYAWRVLRPHRPRAGGR